jgi:DNA-binding XRE family transcriptional regulator
MRVRDDEPMEMADVVRSRRTALGLSQAELAAATGLNVRQIARYEAGEQQPVLGVAVAGQWWASWQTSKDGVPRVGHPQPPGRPAG